MSVPFERLEGKYEILEKLREGGMGAVYKVRHRLLEEIRVVKVIRPQLEGDEAMQARFLREARMAVRLRHRNIAQLFDFTVDEEGTAYLVMEFIDGVGLDELLRRHGPPSLGLALEIALQGLEAIGYMHRKGLVHRDISPDNLMLTRDDEGRPLVKLIDLGLARTLEEDSRLTLAGTFVGKVRYAAPEQFRDHAAFDRPSDVYSMGVVLYELLTGTHPIRGSTLSQLIAGHLFEPPVPFEVSDPEGRIPKAVRDVVLRALAKSPEERFPDADAMAEALRPVARRHPAPDAELDRVLETGEPPTIRFRAVGPGSSQARLDLQFAPVATPRPASGGDAREASASGPEAPAPPPGPGSAAGDREDAGAGAPGPATARAPDTARLPSAGPGAAEASGGVELEEVEALLAREGLLPPQEGEARGGAVRREEQPDPQARVSRLLASARSAAERGELEAAAAMLRRALDVAPDDHMVARVLEEVEGELERRRREERLRSAVDAVDRLLAAEQPAAARAVLERARQEVGDSEVLERLAARIELAEAAAGRHDVLAEAIRRIEEAAARGELEEARRGLSVARRLFGPHPALEALEARLAPPEPEPDLPAAVRELLRRAEAAESAGQLERALAELQHASLEVPESPAIQARLQQLRRRQAELEIEGALAAGDLERAEDALALAERLFPPSDRLRELRRRLEAARGD